MYKNIKIVLLSLLILIGTVGCGGAGGGSSSIEKSIVDRGVFQQGPANTKGNLYAYKLSESCEYNYAGFVGGNAIIYNDNTAKVTNLKRIESTCVVQAVYEYVKLSNSDINATQINTVYRSDITFYDNNSKIYYILARSSTTLKYNSSRRLIAIMNDGLTGVTSFDEFEPMSNAYRLKEK